MEPTVSSEMSEIRTHTPGIYPKRNELHLDHGESLKTRNIICSTTFSENRAVYEIMWKNNVQPEKP